MHATGSGPTPSPGQALLTLRIIGGSMGMGVTLFALVSWFTHQEASPVNPAGDTALMFNIMVALAAAAAVAALVFWRARVSPLVDRRAGAAEEETGDWLDRFALLQTNLIILWALLEGASLFTVVVYFLYGITTAGVLGMVLIWTGLALTWPRREWIGAES